jgi:hypothetical protein
LIVMLEIEAMLDEGGAGKGVVADAVSAHPRIQQRKREKKDQEKPSLRFACGCRNGIAHVLVLHKRSLTETNTRVAD